MSVASRPVSTGKTRTCPHCKATILESLSICPGCMHHLRFDSEAAKRQVAAAPALRVEGIIRHPPLDQPLEYFVIIAIRNDRGEEVTRQVVNVGALQAGEKRTFSLSVEVLPPAAPVPTKSNSATGTFKSPISQPTATVRPQEPAAGARSGTAPQQGSGAQSASGSQPGSSAQQGSAQQAPAGQPASAAKPGAGTASDSGSQPPSAGQSSSSKPGARPAPTAGGSTASGSGANPSAANKPGTSAPSQPGSQSGSTATNKPASGYVLKPPSPGGPKRH
jgi:hypothetical protein